MAKLTVQKLTREVFYSPKARRHFFTRKAASRAEASAMMRAKYPSERGDEHDRGWHWTEDERLCRVFNRLTRLIHRSALNSQVPHD